MYSLYVGGCRVVSSEHPQHTQEAVGSKITTRGSVVSYSGGRLGSRGWKRRVL